MKILLITTVYKSEVVGPARFARLLEASTEVDVDILTSGNKETNSLKGVHLKFRWWQKKLKIYFGIKQFQNKLIEIEDQYDFLIFNSAILAYKCTTKKPYLVMVNDEKLIGLRPFFKFDFIRRFIHKKAEREAVLRAQKVIVNSDYLKSKLIAEYNVKPNNVHKLLKGISLENKQKRYIHRSLTSKSIIKILFVKNDYLIGGLLELLEALGLLSNIRFEITIIGSSILDRKNLSKPKNAILNNLGMISNSQVIEAMYNSNILCIPARFEPLGVAVMEALAVGIPTITTGQGGLHEVTENGKHVWECKPNDPQSIADQIRNCIDDPESRKAKSISGRAYVHDKFNFDKVTSRLMEIINDSL